MDWIEYAFQLPWSNILPPQSIELKPLYWSNHNQAYFCIAPQM